MNKLKTLLENWFDGKQTRACKMPPVAYVWQLVDIYNGSQTEFIADDIKRVLDYCKIPYKEKGIGWKVVK